MTEDDHRRPTTKIERVAPPSRRSPSGEIAAVDAALAEADEQGPETRDSCPACESCSLCRGTHTVTRSQKKAYEELTKKPSEDSDG